MKKEAQESDLAALVIVVVVVLIASYVMGC